MAIYAKFSINELKMEGCRKIMFILLVNANKNEAFLCHLNIFSAGCSSCEDFKL